MNAKIVFQIISGINGGLITGAALLQTLFGQDTSLKIVAVLGIIGIIINSVGAAISGNLSQDQQVKQVLDMKGVERLRVNADASPELAALAMNPNINKISPTEEARSVVAATAAKAT